MRILFLASRLPFPPNRGDRLRAFNVIRKLSSDGHEIHLASFISGERERENAVPLKAYCKSLHLVTQTPSASWANCILALTGRVPLQIAYYKSRRMASEIRSVLRSSKIDLIFVHLFRMAGYVADEAQTYKVLDLTDVISREIERSLPHRRGLSRLIYSRELPRIREVERSLSASFDECWVVSDAEGEALTRLNPSAVVQVVPNGVDLEGFRPLNARPSNIVTFVGHLGVPHNVDAVLHFYKEIFPLVLKEMPDCRFCVIGPSAHRSLDRLRRDRRVMMMDFVEDLNGSLNRSSVFVAPLRYCAGLQNKVLEAMAAGVPVVATPCVNEGLRAKEEEEILIASDPWHFASSVVSLLNDAPYRRYVAEKARKFVEARFSWETASRRIAAIGAGRVPGGIGRPSTG
ncbi:MAG: glycosyltransferase [Candidatus Eisenbacteria bacterium]